MNQCISKASAWLDKHKKLKQWLWFFILWCSGFLTMILLSYLIKLIMNIN